jgi:2-polyprenyl-3-methyl-5-hydroxy-6-metoxy-1,4-benzoquinol methylase
MEANTRRRTGDEVEIPGDYQYRALHEGNAVQRFWHQTKQVTIARYLPPLPDHLVLDVGCGSGVIADFLANSGASVIGIDGSEAAITFARQTFNRPNLRFEQGLVDRTFTIPRPANAIYCLEVIEHIYPDQAADMLRVFRGHLAPGGRVYLTTPNAHSFWPVLEKLLDASGKAPAMGDAQHVAAYSRRRLAQLCAETGFVVERLVTTSLFAPWLAPLSWTLARGVNAVETGSPFGCILVCVARKDGH